MSDPRYLDLLKGVNPYFRFPQIPGFSCRRCRGRWLCRGEDVERLSAEHDEACICPEPPEPRKPQVEGVL